ncbi:MAG: type IV pilin protein [Acidobacteriota bacterium]
MRSLSWRSRGFTLIELMITVAIVAILAAVAYPSYTEHVAKGRRADARARMMAAQQWMERYYSERYRYTSTGETTRNTDFDAQTSFVTSPPASEGATMYTLGVTVAGTTYTLTATRQTGSAMAHDPCGDLTLTQDGTRSVVNYDTDRYATLPAAVAACWH